MGVQGLLQLLKPALRDCNLSQFRGQTAVVDIMTWLYKGAYAYSYELGLDQHTLGFLAYPLKMLKLVQTYGIKPICVFDGLHLKAKEATEKVRSHNKRINKELAIQKAEDGNEEEARKYFMRSLILRSKMIDLFIDILKQLEIEMVIAPYEADSQIAYMVKEGIADFAISEDSDLIAYGCPKLLMKLNFNGFCKVFCINDFKNNTKITDQTLAYLQKATREQFVQICIMAGCEYLPSIQQVGLKVAIKFFSKHDGDVHKVIESMKTNKTFQDRVPEGYLPALKKVQQLFFYQTVYDSRTGKLTSLEKVQLQQQQINDIASPNKNKKQEEEKKQQEEEESKNNHTSAKKQFINKKQIGKTQQQQSQSTNNTIQQQLDLEYMGEYIESSMLNDFVSGRLKKSTMSLRENYIRVIDFKRLMLDYVDNQISERSFICVDRKFFNNDFQQSDRMHGPQGINQHEEIKNQNSNNFGNNNTSSRYYNNIQNDKSEIYQPVGLVTQKKKILDDDLGFCLDEDSGDSQDNFLYNNIVQAKNSDSYDNNSNEHSQIAEIKVKQLNFENKFLQNDLQIISSVHVEMQQLKQLSQQQQQQYLSQISVGTPSNINRFNNKFAKNINNNIPQLSQRSEQAEQLNNNQNNDNDMKAFKKFDSVLPVLIEEEEKKDKYKYNFTNTNNNNDENNQNVNNSKKGKLTQYATPKATTQNKNKRNASKEQKETENKQKQTVNVVNNKKRKLEQMSKSTNNKQEKPNGKLDAYFLNANKGIKKMKV